MTEYEIDRTTNVLRSGVAKIIAHVSAGAYTITEQWRTAGGANQNATAPVGRVAISARDINALETGAADDLVFFWEAQKIDGTIETLISVVSNSTTPSANSHDILSAPHTDSVTDDVVAGDLVYGNATPKWDRKPIGETDEVLMVVAGGPEWTALPSNDTTGFIKATVSSLKIQGSDSGEQTIDDTFDYRDRLIRAWIVPEDVATDTDIFLERNWTPAINIKWTGTTMDATPVDIVLIDQTANNKGARVLVDTDGSIKWWWDVSITNYFYYHVIVEVMATKGVDWPEFDMT